MAATVVGKYVPEVPAKYYITGDSALVADAIGDATLAWNPKAIKAEQDTVILTLKANQEYNLQVIDGDSWKGYSDLTEKAEGLKAGGEYGNNIIFTLAEAGDVQVIYKAGELFKLVGAFYVEPAEQKFYITGSANLVGEENQWQPNAIEVKGTEYTFANLAAGDYMMKITMNGTWIGDNNVKGFDALTEVAEGLTRGQGGDDDNICFTLAEAGDVKVTYIAGEQEVFKLEGNFYVKPIVEPAKFYVTGDSALVADAAGDASLAWNPSAIKSMTDTLVLNLKADQYYILKVSVNGTWVGENNVKGYNELTEVAEGLDDVSNDHNIGFKLNAAGEVKVIYIAGEQEVFKLEGDFYVEPITPDTKYFLKNNWDVAAEWTWKEMTKDGELYKLENVVYGGTGVNFNTKAEDAGSTWVAEADFLGDKIEAKDVVTLTLNPTAGSITATLIHRPGAGLDNINAGDKAVKRMHDGQVVIIRGEHVYTIMGQMIQ